MSATSMKGLRVNDGYGPHGFKRMMRSNWGRNYQQIDQKTRRRLNGQRERLCLCWSHFMMCRGETMRMARLQDLHVHAFEFADLAAICLGSCTYNVPRENKRGWKDAVRRRCQEQECRGLSCWRPIFLSV